MKYMYFIFSSFQLYYRKTIIFFQMTWITFLFLSLNMSEREREREWEWQTASSRKLFIGNVTETEYCIQSIKGQIIRALTACMIFWAFVALGKICNSILKEYANMLKLYLLIYSNFFSIEYFWRMVLYGWSIAE